MRLFFVVFFLISFLYANEIEHASNLSLKYISYDNFDNELLFNGKTNLKYIRDSYEIKSELKYLYSNRYEKRKLLELNELYLTAEYDESKFEMGKSIKYWGELEGYNITDIFNQKDSMTDPFENSSKIGSYTINYTRYLDNDIVEIGAKLYEEDKKIPNGNMPYSITNLKYDNSLEVKSSKHTPSIYLKYNLLTNKYLESDSKFILWHGYDNKRYFVQKDQSTLSQYAYKVNKLLFFSNIIYENIIFKLEATYTDIVDDKKMSDYTQVAFGAEFGSYDMDQFEVSFYSEYYNYYYKEKQKIKNIDISEIYNNDIFLATKINFNDTKRSELKSGILYDISNSEKVFKTTFKSSIKDNIILNLEYLHAISDEVNTPLGNTNNDRRATLALSYIF